HIQGTCRACCVACLLKESVLFAVRRGFIREQAMIRTLIGTLMQTGILIWGLQTGTHDPFRGCAASRGKKR
ncbi:MAG TPA: hypothetical protein VMU62_08445, partial [Acidobacteriaceae bacterium]|nr:hypothetical protein [Acidobacteriaceae bacterium]